MGYDLNREKARKLVFGIPTPATTSSQTNTAASSAAAATATKTTTRRTTIYTGRNEIRERPNRDKKAAAE